MAARDPYVQSALLAELFLEDGDVPMSLQSRRPSGARGPGCSGRRSLPRRSQKSKKSLSSQFKASLTRLMEVLGSTAPHYIHCIKPNSGKQPFVEVVEQLRACGVLETIQISASGYPSRWMYQEFLERYRPLMSREELKGTNMKQICSSALGRLLQDPSKYECGQTEVFLRAGQAAVLEKLRVRSLRAACALLQRHARGLLARRFVRMLQRTRAAVVLQKSLRMVLARRWFLRLRQATITIQAFARGLFARRRYREMVRHRKAVLTQAAVWGWLARRRYGRVRRAVLLLQCCLRRARACRELCLLRLEARSFEHCKQLHRGMEIKAQEKQQLVEQLSGLRAAYAEKLQCLRDEMRRLQVYVARNAQVQQLAQLERHSCLGLEVKELRQRLVETEAVKLQLEEERDALIQRMLEQSQDLGELHQRAARELEEERERYRSLEQHYARLGQDHARLELDHARLELDHARLEQHYARLELDYENQRDEVAFHRQNTWRRSPSSGSFQGSESSFLSFSMSTAPSRDDSDLQDEGLEEPQPGSESLSGGGGQDPLEKSFFVLKEELDLTWEEVLRFKGSVQLEEKKPLELLQCRNRAEVLGLGGSSGQAVGDDLRHASDAVQVTNRLLVSQLREEKQQHEEEVQGLHLDMCSLEQLRQQQAALIQELQSQEGLQYRVLQENWELARKLEEQKTTLKLLKQLGACTKQMEELAATRGAPGPAPAVVLSQSLPGLSQAMLVWRKEDEGRIIKAIITDYQPQTGPGALPDLPAYVLFLCLRHTDHCHDEPRARSLLDAAIDAIKRLVKQHSGDLDTVALWLANTCRLLNCLRQYGRDERYRGGNTARQNEHRLRNVDPRSCCRSLSLLAVRLYLQLIRTAERGLKPLIVAAMLEGKLVWGLCSPLFLGPRRSSSAPANALPKLLQCLGSFCATLDRHGLAPGVGHQALRQLLFLINSTTLNCLLLRKDVCSWSGGIQLRYNISQLEQWLRAQGLQQSGACEMLEPLAQAAQLLQVKKVTEEDARALCSLCTALTPQQVVKILRAYTPAMGVEECVSPHFIGSVERRLQDQCGEGPDQLLVDTTHLFPVHLPFTPSPLHLDELHIPDTLNLAFLGRL